MKTNIKDLHKTVKKGMLAIAFENRKQVYSIFEFDYLYSLEGYKVERHYQAVYQLTDEETNRVYNIEFFTQKNGDQTQIKTIRLVEIIRDKDGIGYDIKEL